MKLDAVTRLSPVEKVVAVEDVVVDTSMETVVDMGEAVVEDVRVGYTEVKALVEGRWIPQWRLCIRRWWIWR